MSDVGVGTTVTIYLPKIQSEQSISKSEDKCVTIRSSITLK